MNSWQKMNYSCLIFIYLVKSSLKDYSQNTAKGFVHSQTLFQFIQINHFYFKVQISLQQAFLLIFLKNQNLSDDIYRECPSIEFIIISTSVRMQPFDQAIKKQNNSQYCNQTNFNIPINSGYSFNTLLWNIDYSSLMNATYYPLYNCFYLPNSLFSGLDEIKSANQATRSNQTLEVNQIQKKQQLAQVKSKQEIKYKKSDQLKINQKYGRNILSNIFHITIKKLLSPQFSKIITKAIQTNQMTITPQNFKQRLEEKTKEIKSYINMKFIKNLKMGKVIGATKQDIQFGKLLRILGRIYNHIYHIPYMFHTAKIKKDSRGLHMQSLRRLSKNKK